MTKFLVLLSAICSLNAVEPNTWPQWRGPARTGHTTGVNWPANFQSLEVIWRAPLDKGYPGPIVAEDRVFVAETANADTEVVKALDRKTGKELWHVSWKGKISVPFYAKKSGDWIRSTPAFDGSTLYVGGMEEVLVALDGKTGRELWRVDFPNRFRQPKPEFGFASSPLLDGEFLYVQAANSVVKLNKKDGSTAWRALEHGGGVMESGAFSSPVLATVAGKKQIVVGTRTSLAGLDAASGSVLWSRDVPNYRGMNILTPMVIGDQVFTSLYREDSFLFSIKDNGGKMESKEVWKNKAKGYMSTPVVIGDYLYIHLMSQRFSCINLKTGETKWTTEPYGQYWSMAVSGDKILALDEAGKLLLIRANPEKFELLDSREVSQSSTWAHIAIAGKDVFVRELTGITAYRWDSAVPSVGQAKTK